MQRSEAQRLIKETFGKAYNEEYFKHFVSELFPNLESKNNVYSGSMIKDAFKGVVESYKYISKYIAPDKTEVAIISVKLFTKQQLEKSRSLQRNFVSWFMKDRNKEVVIAAFYTDEDNGRDWRFSFVKQEKSYDFEAHKTTTIFSPAKRYSYLVGINENNHTAQQQLVPLLEKERHSPTLAELESTFAVEKVSDEFFEKYKGLYLNLVEEIEKIIKKDEIVRSEFEGKISTELFCKKLLGQIVFLYFIQKKGWLGVRPNEPWGTGDRQFLRTLFNESRNLGKNCFNDYLEPLFYKGLAEDRTESGSYYEKLDCKIPFLNGGLFDPVGGYDWIKTDVKIPNELFSNTSEEGILDVFDRYNFTVKEDEPLEKEVAIDPEMLGKVFENLLEIKDRKSKGAFYTPREIVHYMCQESLISYLQTKLGDKTKLEDVQFFIRYGDTYSEIEDKVGETIKYKSIFAEKAPTIESNALEIDNALANVKICDPAVGSGAFPVGLMHEIIRARNTLLNAGFISSDKSRNTYEYKRQIIQDSIYGVDIEESAIEVAKLRLWLSLVVDEDNMETIKPLPNLDYKMVCGNSLLGLDSGLNFFADITSEIEKKKEEFFNETDKKRKAELKQEITDLLDKLTDDKTKIFDFKVYFSEVWKSNNGFDIVIGNPPYITYKGKQKVDITDAELRQIINNFSNSAEYKINSYALFVELAPRLTNKNGTWAYIIPSTILQNEYLKKIRRFILENQTLLKIVSFGNKIFRAVTDSIILIGINRKNITNVGFLSYRKNDLNLSNMNDCQKLYSSSFINSSDCIINIKSCNDDVNIFSKISKCSQPLSSYLEANIGIKRANAPVQDMQITQKYKKFILGRNIERYHITFTNKYILFETKLFHTSINEHIFLCPLKIVVRKTGNSIIATLDSDQFYTDQSLYNLYPKAGKIVNMKFILGILNSKLINFYYTKNMITNADIFPYIKGIHLKQLPIINSSESDQNRISDLVNKILDAKKADSNTDTSDLESQIDQLVYKLYDLTPTEIAIVESK